MNEIVTDQFIQACRDYFYLIDRKYPERGSLKLTGDRYRLSGDQRTVLYRGIASREKSRLRESHLTREVRNSKLLIDGYNVLFSLLNYRMGRIMFLSTDRILRDAGSLHGKIRNESLFDECVHFMTQNVVQLKPESVEVYLDAPVSHSEKHAMHIRECFSTYGIAAGCEVVRSADWPLKQSHEGVVATSDSVIVEKPGIRVFDLARYILEKSFQPEFLDLNRILHSK